jgi:iron complex outermembrane recepter protein
MNSTTTLRTTIAAILRGSALGTLGVSTLGVGLAHAAASDADVADSGAIPEIVVTAERRTESLENVPITIQAISGDELQKLNVETLDDVLRYTPNVTFSGNGPGQGNIFMRGLSAGGAPNQSQSTTSPFPNVALYLDDQSMQFPGRNNDPYLIDIERIEVLEGPQGTLFGGGAEAGAIRYITNKPKLDVTEGNANAGYGYTSGGDPNFMANATINLPLIPDTLAVRATVFTDRRGGYISNVPGSITVIPEDGRNATPSATNASLVGSNLNPVDYDGLRVSALWKINEDWNFLVQENYQNMEADGYFSDYPFDENGKPLQPYQIVAFQPAYDKDNYESTSWTLSGNLPEDLKLVYAGSYLDRHIHQQADYSNYLRSTVGAYYTCTGAAAYAPFKTAKPTTCYAPVGNWNDTTKNTHLSQELRVSTPDDWRIRGLVGAFYESFKIYDVMNFNYLPIPQCGPAGSAILTAALDGGPDCLSAIGPLPGSPSVDPALRVGTNTAFGEDVYRGYRQTAFFASADVDIIPKVLTFTAGTRWFHYSEFEEGSQFSSESAKAVDVPDGACTAVSCSGLGINLKKTETGTRSRLNLTWHITPDIMAYYTYSQGFRPGGFNRTSSLNGVISLAGEAKYIKGDKATEQYNKPDGYNSDNLINNEVGAKAELFDHRLQLNASAYYMYWSNTQFVFFDPVHLGNTTFVVNGPSYSIKGLELQFVARVTEGLTLQGSGSWNSSNQYTSPCLQSTRPTATNPTPLGTCITQINSAPYANPFGQVGTRAAFSPPFEYNVRGRYDFRLADYKPFVSIGANYIGAMANQPANYPSGYTAAENPPTTTLARYIMPGYYTYDAALGVVKDNWTVQIIGSNLSNSDASQFTSSGQYIESEVPLRPRVVTLQVGMKF